MIARLRWACLCVVVWPIYYASLWLKWLIPYWPFWTVDRAREHDVALYDQLRSPPFLDRLRPR